MIAKKFYLARWREAICSVVARRMANSSHFSASLVNIW